MGHYCHVCGRHRPNEKFSGKGHARHICKECARRPRAEREREEIMEELWRYWFQSNLSPKNRKRLEVLEAHTEPEVRAKAALLREVALAHPGKRRRLKHLRKERPDLWARLVEQGFVEEWPPMDEDRDPSDLDGLWGEAWNFEPADEDFDPDDVPF